MISDLRKDEIIEIIDYVRVMSNNKVPILIENNLELAAEIKADGVHLTSGQKLVKTAKSLLGEYPIQNEPGFVNTKPDNNLSINYNSYIIF